ncbi:hypothetical protein ACFC26_12880 [Kitasatospora purpeofusca]|uniref:hypothetical protein n=1 Tax=Kitasatospora purpeofusca TaxID=67352 RepID=UPI0035DA1CC5
MATTTGSTAHSSADCVPDLPCMGFLPCDYHRAQGVVVSLLELAAALPGLPAEDCDCAGFLRCDRHRG